MYLARNIRSALGAAAALLSVVVFPARAQDRPPANLPAPSAVTGAGPIAQGELVAFEAFLDRRPYIEARLRENPALLTNPAFLKNHPLLEEFIDRHPRIGNELAARPRWFIHRELVRQSAIAVTPAQVADFDRFLDQHPRIERILVQRPQLLRNPEFLGRVPELRTYLKQHQGIDRAAESKPGRLMQREKKRERTDEP